MAVPENTQLGWENTGLLVAPNILGGAGSLGHPPHTRRAGHSRAGDLLLITPHTHPAARMP